jgi:alkanesulfonate monooxygenase
MLDNATGGKSFLGTGIGWYEPEFTASNIDFKRRSKLYEEWLHVIRQLLSGKPVNHQGTFFQMKDAELFPKPLQKPHPPLMLGGSPKYAAKRIARYGDGWLPYMASLADCEEGIVKIKDAWREERRSGKPRLMADFWTVIDKTASRVEAGSKFLVELSSRPPWKASLETVKGKNLLGTPRQIKSRIEDYVKLGVEQIILGFPPYGKELDMMKLYGREVIPNFS